VLRPLLFTAYVSPVGELVESHGVSYHQFADDTQSEVVILGTAPQLRLAVNIREVEVCRQQAAGCAKAEVTRRNDRLAPTIRLSRQ